MNVRAIRPLPETVINQIAAGEVIERPASIVKELVENALDAGAGGIEIEIEDGGIARVQVRDDGAGIPGDELTLALTRHCTSKIASPDDLPLLVTLGFRGEALAAIAAVAETSILSRRADDAHGWRITQGPEGQASAPEPVSHPQGTTVVARELFARLPARRRFLKRPQTEALHVEALVRRVAFCTPAVGFTLSVDGARRLHLPAAQDERSATRRQRALFGAEFVAHARYIDLVLGELRISGWVGEPRCAHAQADLQMFAVNGRSVRDRRLLHAVRMAFDARLPPGRHACFGLHLEMAPDAVDVNVHPGKLEVRFRDLRTVHDCVFTAVRQALADPSSRSCPARGGGTSPPLRARDGGDESPRFTPAAREPLPAGRDAARATSETARVLRVVAARYVLRASDETLDVLDLAGWVEATLRRRLAAERTTKSLLIPQRVECPDAASVPRLAARLAALGMETSALGERVLALRSVPLALPPVDADRFGPALVRQLLDDEAETPEAALAAATAEALLVPALVERDAWLERLLTAGRAVGLDETRYTRALDAARLRGVFAGPV